MPAEHIPVATGPTSTAPPAPEPDLGEFEAVYRAHHAFVWRSLRRLGVTADDIADATHEVFLVVSRRLPGFEGRSSLRTWLFAIAIRVAQSLRRDRQREARHMQRFEEILDGAVRDEPHRRHEAAELLHLLLDDLDTDKRTVFVLVELEGMTVPEIAEALGVKVPTIYSRLRLARVALERAVRRFQAQNQRRNA